jgi:hypothetical protein
VNRLKIRGLLKKSSSFPKKIEMVVTTILESKDLSSFSIEEIMGSLISHETRLNLEEGSIEHVFKTHKTFSRGKGNRGRNQRGRGRENQNIKYKR